MKEIPDNIKADLDIKAVKWIDEVLEIALKYQPKPIEQEVDEVVATKEKPEKTESGQIKPH